MPDPVHGSAPGTDLEAGHEAVRGAGAVRDPAVEAVRNPVAGGVRGAEADVLIVGGGTAGCVLAARLAAAGRSVRLLEAGPVRPPPDLRRGLARASSLAGSVPGHPLTWVFPGRLTPSRPYDVPRGRVLGGSSAINGAYFTRGTPDDYGWAPGWSYADLLPYFRAMETDHDCTGSAHGAAGPMPVARPSGALLSPAAEAFLAACRTLGHPDEPDRNAGGPPGAGPVPANVRDGVRVSTAAAYLPEYGRGPDLTVTGSARTRPNPAGTGSARANLNVTGGAVVRRVIIERGRAIGVEADIAGERTALYADEIVLAAGAITTAHLLLLSGIGPPADLRTHGIPVIHDAPVGAAFHDHPQIWIPYRTARPLPVRPGMILTQAALDAGDTEILATGIPMSLALTGMDSEARTASSADEPVLTGEARTADELALIVTLTRPESRGSLALASPDPNVPPRLEYGYLGPDADRKRLAGAVRHGRELLRTPPLRDLVADFTAPDDLDAQLQTAFHLSGTAPIGAVTDPYGRVHGVDGLRVADTALIPAPLRRGPAATAVLIGERVASFLT